MNELKCKICFNEQKNRKFCVKEMMLGLRDAFLYFECSSCGCIQIAEFPLNMDRYYPPDYYSFNEHINVDNMIPDRFSIFLKKQLISYYSGKKNMLGVLLALKYKNELPWLKQELVNFSYRVLDVGCGNGKTLNQLFTYGFKHLRGIDPFIKEKIDYPNGIKISKVDIENVETENDIVMFHQSFEHMRDPVGVLKEAYRVLSPEGHLVIRVPIASSYAWRKYGTNWVQLDAPRHFFLHSIKSMKIVAAEAGFQSTRIIYDSTDFQFVGSEAYLRNVSLVEYYSKPDIFSSDQKRIFAREAEQLNKRNDGDSACFYFRKR